MTDTAVVGGRARRAVGAAGFFDLSRVVWIAAALGLAVLVLLPLLFMSGMMASMTSGMIGPMMGGMSWVMVALVLLVLLAGAALTNGFKLPNMDRDELLHRARSDLAVGLGNAPMRGIVDGCASWRGQVWSWNCRREGRRTYAQKPSSTSSMEKWPSSCAISA